MNIPRPPLSYQYINHFLLAQINHSSIPPSLKMDPAFCHKQSLFVSCRSLIGKIVVPIPSTVTPKNVLYTLYSTQKYRCVHVNTSHQNTYIHALLLNYIINIITITSGTQQHQSTAQNNCLCVTKQQLLFKLHKASNALLRCLTNSCSRTCKLHMLRTYHTETDGTCIHCLITN